MTSPSSGFSLLEALIALAILAVASAGLVGAAEAHVDRIGGLEHRAAASWVAENALAETRLAGGAPTTGPQTYQMAGQSWRVEVEVVATDDPDLVRIDVRTSGEADRQPAARLSGFADTGVRR